MRGKNVQPVEPDPDGLIHDFVTHINDYVSFAPPESSFAQSGTGSSLMRGGFFAHVTQENGGAGVYAGMAFLSDDSEQNNLVMHHTVLNYPDIVGPLQSQSESKLDEVAGGLIYEVGQDLLSQKRKVLGGFVLMSNEEVLTPQSDTFLTAFVTRSLGTTIRFRARDEALDRVEGDIELEPAEVEAHLTNQADEEKIQNLALHLMAGLFPPAKRIHKVFGVRRRPRRS